MLIQTQTRRPFSRTMHIANQIRDKELFPMCIIRLKETENNPSLLELARRCKNLLAMDLSCDLDVVFVGLNAETMACVNKFRKEFHVHTIGDWTRSLKTFLAPGSDYCPKCGEKSFKEPVLYCTCCGANPGTVFEHAGGVFKTRSS